MKNVLVILAAAALCAGCGNNLAGPSGTNSLRPPTALSALSLDSAHVRLSWTASANAADTTFAGYVVTWGIVADTGAKSSVQFTAGPVGRGAVTFSVRSLLKSGQISDAAPITWAGAWRFDAVPLVVTEFNSAQQAGSPGVDAGTATSNPQLVSFVDANADSTLDFYLTGPSSSPLQFAGASNYSPGWHQTLFSTVTTASADLNAALTSFPSDNTFTLGAVTLTDNTIYYVRLIGNTGEVNYARVHVHLLGGSYPSRTVDVRISLQKVSRLPYA